MNTFLFPLKNKIVTIGMLVLVAFFAFAPHANAIGAITSNIVNGSTITSWNPQVTWPTGTTVCAYNFDQGTNGPHTGLACGDNGSDIPAPSAGSHTIDLEAYDGVNLTDLLVSFTYSPPTPVSSCADFEAINSNMSGSYLLTQDIDCSGDGVGVTIGNSNTPFTGTFDGGGHTITVDITSSNVDAGLFAHLTGATIKNLGIAGSVSMVSPLVNTGSLAGESDGSTIISNVGSVANVSSVHYSVGGLIGSAQNTAISDSYWNGTLTDTNGSSIGGLVGQAYTGLTIDRSYTAGSLIISSGDVTGGIVGYVAATDLRIRDSFTVVNNPNTGSTTGAIVGFLQSGYDSAMFVDDLWDAPRTSQSNCASYINTNSVFINIPSGGGCTSVNAVSDGAYTQALYFKNNSTNAPFIGGVNAWDFSNVWQTVSDGYPILRVITSSTQPGNIDDDTVAPGQPTGLTSTKVGVHDVLLSWTAPTSSGAGSINNYIIEYAVHQSDVANDIWNAFDHSQSTSTTIDVTGLQKTTAYDFRVSATNSQAQSAPSDVYNTTTSAPSGNTGEIKVTVTDPTGAPISGATVNIDCPAGDGNPFVLLGTTDVNGVVEVDPTTVESNCQDQTSLSLQASVNGYVSYEGDYLGQYAINVDPDNQGGGTQNEFSIVLLPDFAGSGSGTVNDPYIVTDCLSLESMASNLSADYKIVPTSGTTIDCSTVPNFQPIGNSTTPFTGMLDGNGTTITNLTLNFPSNNDIGFFGDISGATITNLTFGSGNIDGSYNVGSVAGRVIGSATLENITSAIVFAGNSSNEVGGIIGSANLSGGSTSTFSNLTYTGSLGIANGGSDLGGIVGYLDVENSGTQITMDNATVSGSSIGLTSGYGGDIGGIAGYVYASDDGSNATTSINVLDATVSSDVTGEGNGSDVGGLYGYVESGGSAGTTNITSVNDTVSGTISGNSDIGGLVGGVYTYDNGSAISALFNQDTMTGNVVANGNTVGGLFGVINSYGNSSDTILVKVTNSSNTGDVTGDAGVGGILGTTESEGPGVVVNGGGETGGLVFQNVYATGNVTGNVENDAASNVGGFAGHLMCASNSLIDPYGCVISSSYSSATVSGYQNVGGFIGQDEGDVSVVDSYASGSVTGNTNAGGLIGYVNQDINKTQISRTYAAGGTLTVSPGDGSAQDIGGLIGRFDTNGGPSLLTDSFSSVDLEGVSGITNVGWMVGALGSLTPSDLWYYPGSSATANCNGSDAGNASLYCTLENSNTFFQNSTTNGPFPHWDFNLVWVQNSKYPTLTGSVEPIAVPVVSITAPTASQTLTTWSPAVNWSTATECEYSYGSDVPPSITVSCTADGSDIPEPDLGAQILNVEGVNQGGASIVASVGFTYNPNIANEVGTTSAYWTFDETVRGTTVADSSGNNNTGTVMGTPTPSTNAPQLRHFHDTESLSFNPSTNDYISVPTASTLNASGSFSLAFWMKPTTWNDNTSQGILSKWDADSGLGFIVYDDGSSSCEGGGDPCGPLLNFRIHGTSGTEDYLSSQSPVDVGVWQHWAVVYNAATHTVSLYKNGVLDAQYVGVFIGDASNTTALTIGLSQPWNGYFNGSLDDVRIYQNALSADDVAYLAATVTGPMLTLTQITPIPSQVTASNAIYHYSSSGVGQYLFTQCSNSGNAEVHNDPTSGVVTFTGLQIGTVYKCQMMEQSDTGGVSNILKIGPFTVIAPSSATTNVPAPVLIPSSSQAPTLDAQTSNLLQGTPSAPSYSTPGVTNTTGSNDSASHYVFLRNLKKGMTGADVKILQQFLNAHGAQVSISGVGSPGKESTFFGLATTKALIKYQEAHAKDILAPFGLKKGTGLFYTTTRKFVNAVIAGQ